MTSSRNSCIALFYALVNVPAFSVAADRAGIEEIVVTARGVEESLRDIPVALTVLNEEALQRLSITSLEEVAAVTPQVDVVRAGSGSGASINIRGIGSTPTSIGIEQSVAVVVDGVYYPQGRVINETTFDARQVAILKGPQALYFGKNATAGVISIETNDPADEWEVLGRMAYETAQERRVGEGVISMPIADDAGVRFAFRRVDMKGGFLGNADGATTYTTLDAANGFAPTVHANPAPQEDQWSGEDASYGRLTFVYDPTDWLSFNLKGSYTDFEIRSPTGGSELWSCPALNGQPQQVVGGQPVPNLLAECKADWRKAENPIPPTLAASNSMLDRFGGQLGEDYDSYSVTGTTKLSFEEVDIVGIVNYHDQTNHWVGDFDGGGATAVMAGEENTFDNFSAEVRAVTELDIPLNFVVGAYYQTTDRQFDQDVVFAGAQNSAALAGNEFTAYKKASDTDGETISAYGEVLWDITERLRVTAGMRWIDESKDSSFVQPYVNSAFQFLFTQGVTIAADQSFDDTIPEVTVSFDATDEITVYAAYKEGFKSGGFSNSGILGAISGSVEDFTFDPESVQGFEAGIKAGFMDNALQIELEVYRYEFDDLQIDFFNSPTFAFITTNAGGSTTTGAEVQTTWSTPIDGLVVAGGLAYNDGEYTDFIAPCYAGQKPSKGCTIVVPGQVPQQDLDGTERALAPEWSGYVGANYDRSIGKGYRIGVTTNLQYKTDQMLSAFGHPADRQDSYAVLDAALRFGSEDGRWEVAIIGKNVTDEYALVGSGDTPSTGGGTGTESGFVADRTGTPILSRTIELAFTVRM